MLDRRSKAAFRSEDISCSGNYVKQTLVSCRRKYEAEYKITSSYHCCLHIRILSKGPVLMNNRFSKRFSCSCDDSYSSINSAASTLATAMITWMNVGRFFISSLQCDIQEHLFLHSKLLQDNALYCGKTVTGK